MHATTSATRGRVLAVDDSAEMRLLVSATLEALGYDVEVADSGYAALEATRQGSFDAVVLDVDMPGIDGLAVGRALRNDPHTRRSIIAMHTSVEEAVVKAGFAEYDAYVAKPCDARVLGERIDRMLRERAAEASPA
jgi:CheY-like chemotaxis protein